MSPSGLKRMWNKAVRQFLFWCERTGRARLGSCLSCSCCVGADRREEPEATVLSSLLSGTGQPPLPSSSVVSLKPPETPQKKTRLCVPSRASFCGSVEGEDDGCCWAGMGGLEEPGWRAAGPRRGWGAPSTWVCSCSSLVASRWCCRAFLSHFRQQNQQMRPQNPGDRSKAPVYQPGLLVLELWLVIDSLKGVCVTDL